MEPQQNEGTQNVAPEVTTTPAQETTNNVEGHSPTLMAVLAYIGPLVLIPFFIAKEDPFVKFHVKQGLVLVVIELILWLLGEFMLGRILLPFIAILNLGLLILSIIGIINVLQKKEAKLPLVGGYSDRFNF